MFLAATWLARLLLAFIQSVLNTQMLSSHILQAHTQCIYTLENVKILISMSILLSPQCKN